MGASSHLEFAAELADRPAPLLPRRARWIDDVDVQQSRNRARYARLLQRPDADTLCESVQVFFIGRNANGYWVARNEAGTAGGTFWFQTSAIRFAERATSPDPCALIFPAERFELDTANRRHPLVNFAAASSRLWTQLAEALTDRAADTGPEDACPSSNDGGHRLPPAGGLKRKCVRWLRRLYRRTAVLGGGFRARSN